MTSERFMRVSTRLRSGLAKALLGAMLLAGLSAAADAQSLGQAVAPAAAPAPESKIAADLQAAISARTTPQSSWVKDVDGTRYVKALIISDSHDPELTQLRAAVIAQGGSVYMRYVSVTALSVLLPAQRVARIANRGDVQSISPNRLTARTAKVTTVTDVQAPSLGSMTEQAAGIGTVRTRAAGNATYSGLDGSGVGIAVLDSGIMWRHQLFSDGRGATRVQRAIDFLKVGDATAVKVKDWTPGIDVSTSLAPGSQRLENFEKKLDNSQAGTTDAYGHGSHVAAIAAGRGMGLSVDATGIAPGATLYDVKVLDGEGYGQMSDLLAGIDWVVHHSREYNIRVMNISLAADSTESYLTDPIARAARSAVAAGITVVAAAGNFGQAPDGSTQYGGIGSPGIEPSVITVGAVNMHDTPGRGDDTVDLFSSRGPTRSSLVDAQGVRHVDNVLKPDLVAAGNKVVSAMATDNRSMTRLDWLARTYPQLQNVPGATQGKGETLMILSGTSVAAPVVSGAAAVLLQANPGLTPPLIKAILQYSAEPLAGENLLSQGAGLVNLAGAVSLAQALRTDVASAIEANSIGPGSAMVAAGKTLPAARTTLNGRTFGWSRVVSAGGSYLVSGRALFTKYQPMYNPRITWVRDRVLRSAIEYWPATADVPGATFPKEIKQFSVANHRLLTPGVIYAGSLLGNELVPLRRPAFSHLRRSCPANWPHGQRHRAHRGHRPH